MWVVIICDKPASHCCDSEPDISEVFRFTTPQAARAHAEQTRATYDDVWVYVEHAPTPEEARFTALEAKGRDGYVPAAAASTVYQDENGVWRRKQP